MSDSSGSGRENIPETCPACGFALVPGSPVLTPVVPGSATELGEPPPVKTPMVAEVPTRIGRFEVRRLLGEGAFGRVFEAYDPTLRRVVALKVAKSEQLGSIERIRRFQGEARSAAHLTHPHIVGVFDAGQDGPHHYIATTFIPGRSLEVLLEETAGQPLPARRCAEVARKLAEALAYAHQSGVIHRDVKPANVLIDERGEPLLADFGLALRSDEERQTKAGEGPGTSAYLAPEQARGKPVEASDQYSLGCVLFEMLTGQLPFVGSNAAHFMFLHQNEPAPLLRRFVAAVPLDLETICLKCLEKEPAQRYADCHQLADDLRRWLDGEPVSARRPGMGERVVRWARRNPVTLLGTLAVMLAVGVAVTGMLARVASNEANLARHEKQQADEARDKASKEKERADGERARADENAREANKQRDRADVLVYAGQLALAQEMWQRNDGKRAIELLDVCRWDLRGWEHHHLWTLFNRNQQTFRGHTGLVWSVAFSPDGKRILTGSDDNTAKVWDAEKGTEVLSLEGHTGAVRSVAFSPDGKRILTGSWDNTIKVWDAQKGQAILSLKGQKKWMSGVAWSPDGTRILTGMGDQSLKLCDAQTGKEVLALEGHKGVVYSVTFSPDGQYILTGGGMLGIPGEAKLWDAQKGIEILSLKGHTNWVSSVAFSPDGKRILTGSADRTVRLWDAENGTELFSLEGHPERVTSVAFSPDGRRVLSGGFDGTARLWDAENGTEVLSLKGHTGPVWSVAFSPSGRRVLTGSNDKTAKVWDVEKGTEGLSLAGHTNRVSSVALSPDGKSVLTASGNRVRLWCIEKDTEILALEGHSRGVTHAAFSPDGERILTSSDNTARIWDARKGTELLVLKRHTKGVTSVAFSPDGRRVLTGSQDNTARIWDAQKGTELLALKGHTSQVRSVAFSPDGRRVLTGSQDNTARLWDAQSGTLVVALEGHTNYVSSVAFSPDGKRVVTGSYDNTAKVWDAQTGTRVLTLEGHTRLVTSVAWSPDGTRILTGSDDNTAKVWDAQRGQEVLTLKGHTLFVTSVAFSLDGRWVVAGSWATVKRWDARMIQEVLPLRGHARPVTSVAFGPDGKRLFAWDAQGKVLAWSTSDGRPAEPRDPPPKTSDLTARSPDGRLIARADGTSVLVSDPRKPTPISDPWVLPTLAERKTYHTKQAALTEKAKQHFAHAFHLGRLLLLSPEERPTLLKRRAAVLSAALKANANDHWAARSLARQAVADPDTVPDAKALLALLSRQPKAALDSLHGTLLLRTGNARDAAIVFRARLRNATRAEPPLDELLLCHALIAQNRHDEARRYLQIAADWMDAGTAPTRALSALGAATAGPLATLTPLAHVPDVRINPLDGFTAHELYTLRRDAERALRRE